MANCFRFSFAVIVELQRTGEPMAACVKGQRIVETPGLLSGPWGQERYILSFLAIPLRETHV